jgi:outer membrane protein TolC
LLTAEANLAQANFELSQAKRDIELAQRQLTKEMGRKEFKPMNVEEDFKVVESQKEKPDFGSLAQSHPSLLQLTAQKNAAGFSLRSAYGNFFPTLSGQAGADKTGAHWAPQDSQWDLGLVLSLPIFEGGLRTAQVAQAKALYNQLAANERSTRDGIIVSLSGAWVSLQDAQETVDVQNKQLAAAIERSKIAEAEYSTGFITYDNWTIIEDNLVRAKTDYLNSQINALLAEANWIQAKGEVLEYAKN